MPVHCTTLPQSVLLREDWVIAMSPASRNRDCHRTTWLTVAPKLSATSPGVSPFISLRTALLFSAAVNFRLMFSAISEHLITAKEVLSST